MGRWPLLQNKILYLVSCILYLDKSIKPGSNSIMTDKHTAEHSRAACLGKYWPKSGVYIAHTTIKPKVSISLTEMPFLRNDFVIGVSLSPFTFVVFVNLNFNIV